LPINFETTLYHLYCILKLHRLQITTAQT